MSRNLGDSTGMKNTEKYVFKFLDLRTKNHTTRYGHELNVFHFTLSGKCHKLFCDIVVIIDWIVVLVLTSLPPIF